MCITSGKENRHSSWDVKRRDSRVVFWWKKKRQCNLSCVENAHLGLTLKRRTEEDIFPEDSHAVIHSLIFFLNLQAFFLFMRVFSSTQVSLSCASVQSSSTRNQVVLCFTTDNKKKNWMFSAFFLLSPCLPHSLLSVSHSRKPRWGQLPDTFHTTFIELELKL